MICFCSFRLSNKASLLGVGVKESWWDAHVRSGYEIEVNEIRNINNLIKNVFLY